MSTTTNPSEASLATRIRVGLFTALGLLLIGAITVFVNDRPYWWRACNPVHIQVEDATGLKTKSPVKSLGLQIGYLRSVHLSETRVRLGICITAPVEVLPETRAYIRGEGFLGDKFVELKPVHYTGEAVEDDDDAARGEKAPASDSQKKGEGKTGARDSVPSVEQGKQEVSSVGGEARGPFSALWNEFSFIREARAESPAVAAGGTATVPAAVSTTTSEETAGGITPVPSPRRSPRKGEIPVGESQDMQQLIQQVDKMVSEMTSLTNNLRESLSPQDLKVTIQRLNSTLENASRTLAPEGGLNQTAQRSLVKLEDAIEQMRDLIARVNRGEGSVGMILTDTSYAEELKKAIINVNRLLSRAGGYEFVVRVGADELHAQDAGRGYATVAIHPDHDRYYLLGASIDPRGSSTTTTTVTTTDGGNPVTVVEEKRVQGTGGSVHLTVMFGKILWKRLDLAIGALHGDGALSTGLFLGPRGREEMLIVKNDIYSGGSGFDDRVQLIARPFMAMSDLLQGVYVNAGLDSIHSVDGRAPFSYGAGITFNDDDIKLLFTFL